MMQIWFIFPSPIFGSCCSNQYNGKLLYKCLFKNKARVCVGWKVHSTIPMDATRLSRSNLLFVDISKMKLREDITMERLSRESTMPSL